MDRRVTDGLRAGATAAGVAAGFMVLASTAQTPDGFVHAGFGGPLDVFGTTTSDVLAIGDGAGDASELAALLKTSAAGPDSDPNEPFRVTVQDRESSNATTVNVFPTVDPGLTAATEDAPPPPSKPAVDARGRVDCTGALTCKTDPVTKATTVTYPDGVVATVQKVNDLTVVAYKRIGENLRADVQAILQPDSTQPDSTQPDRTQPDSTQPDSAQPDSAQPDSAPQVISAPAPNPTPDPSGQTAATAPAPADPEQQPAIPAIDPGPPAPDAAILEKGIDLPRGPKVNVTQPPEDFGPATLPDAEGQPAPPSSVPKLPVLGKVRDAVGSVVDAVKDGLSKAVGPGAAGKTENPGRPGDSGQRSGDESS